MVMFCLQKKGHEFFQTTGYGLARGDGVWGQNPPYFSDPNQKKHRKVAKTPLKKIPGYVPALY